MFLHDHDKKPTGGYYCPLMRGVCIDGWTKEMGEGADGRRPVCIAWRPVTIMIGGPKGTPKESWDCTIGWLPDLMVQSAQESYKAGAATEDARNHIAGQAHFFKQMAIATMSVARKNGVSREEAAQIAAEIREDLASQAGDDAQRKLDGPPGQP